MDANDPGVAMGKGRAIMHLTNNEPKAHKSHAETVKESAGAPACEIEITPQMIEVCAEILKDYFYEEIFEKEVDLERVCTDLFHALNEYRT
jgi:hypothetical protein